MHAGRYWGGGALALAALMIASGGALAQREGDEAQSSCERGWGRSDRPRHCEVRESGRRAEGGTIVVEPGQNGGASIEGWDRDSVHVRAEIQAQARTEEDARKLTGEVRIVSSGGRISAEGPPNRSGASWSVSFVINLPRRSNLSIEAHNGPIKVEGVAGHMRLRTQNGPIALAAVGGDVRARAQNGPITVRLTGTRWDGEGLDAETQNGPLVLDVPDDYNAQLETGTVNGPMTIDFPITVSGRLGRRISTQLGEGGRPVRAVTTNGPVIVRRR
ncbi:MAG: DUF4097 family beta strand repeat-containing protein [Gemmatimonadota bacterium]|nr:DUF4097 family beta strand repeat-containing protein [Gemmatimonadota bacterium]